AGLQVDLEELERDEFRDAQARGVEGLEHGAIAQAERCRRVGRGEQRFDVGLRQRLRKARRALRRIEPERRILGHAPLAHLVLVEALQARYASCGAGSSALPRGQESEQVLLRYLQQSLLGEDSELLKVGPVG